MSAAALIRKATECGVELLLVNCNVKARGPRDSVIRLMEPLRQQREALRAALLHRGERKVVEDEGSGVGSNLPKKGDEALSTAPATAGAPRSTIRLARAFWQSIALLAEKAGRSWSDWAATELTGKPAGIGAASWLRVQCLTQSAGLLCHAQKGEEGA